MILKETKSDVASYTFVLEHIIPVLETLIDECMSLGLQSLLWGGVLFFSITDAAKKTTKYGDGKPLKNLRGLFHPPRVDSRTSRGTLQKSGV